MTRKINTAGLDLIKHFEGFYSDAYLCPANIWTIGYGHTRGVKQGQTVTKEEAEQLLHEDLTVAQAAVENYISVPLADNQFAALVSFTFNLGAGNLQTSTLRRKLNASDYDAVPSELARWVKAGGRTLGGLVRRRAAEGELFMQPDDVPISDEIPLMPQKVSLVDENDSSLSARYLMDNINLEQGSVDDQGDAAYGRLSQNIPDGYVVGLQKDLTSLGFTQAGFPDGAFGLKTKKAVEAFQQMAEINPSGIVDRRTKDRLSLWLRQGYSRTSPPGQNKAAWVTSPNGIKLITPRVPHFSQGDPRWAGRTLGQGSSLRREGCAVTCIAMILNFFGRDVTPGVLDAYLDANSGYLGNRVKWIAAGQCDLSDSSTELVYTRQTGDRDKLGRMLLERIDSSLPTIVRVDYGIDIDLTYNHFVVCVGRTQDKCFIMNDPATRNGDGYQNPGNENIIEKTTRKNGYQIVRLDCYDPVV